MDNIKSPMSVRDQKHLCRYCGKEMLNKRGTKIKYHSECYLKKVKKISYQSVNRKRRKLTPSEVRKMIQQSYDFLCRKNKLKKSIREHDWVIYNFDMRDKNG